MKTTQEIFQEAVTAWYLATGCPTDRFGSFTTEQYELREQSQQLANLLAVDPSASSPLALLRAYFDWYLKTTNFSAHKIITDDEFWVRIQKLRGVRDLLEDPVVVEEVEGFNDRLRQAILHYNAVPNESLFSDQVAMAVLQRDAVMAIHHMRALQFVQGEPATGDLGVNPYVYEFWNIQSLVGAMQAQAHPGISVCLVREPMVLESFFVFAISNGQNLTVLVDKERSLHPREKHMRRRPDREFLKRSRQYHFPYELTDVEATGDSTYEVEILQRTSIVPRQAKAARIAELRDLRSETVMWFAMMFDLIRVKYGVELYKTPKLAYTADMIREPNSIISESSPLVRQGQYQPLVVAPVTSADLTDEKLKSQWGQEPTHVNDWMIERYKDRVPERILNLLGKEDHKLALELEESNREIRPWTGFMGRPDRGRDYHTMDPLDFGTEEELVRDQVWTARYNQMVVIQRLAVREFEETRGEIVKRPKDKWDRKGVTGWYPKMVKKNLPALLQAIAEGKHPLVDAYHLSSSDVIFNWPNSRSYPTCAVFEETQAKRFVLFAPKTAEDLAFLTGVPVKKLPWQLKNWSIYPFGGLGGNHLLSRLDPKDWVLKNPWEKLGLQVKVYISQSGYNKIRKEHGLPIQPLPDWVL